jgi:hypothetical protein
MENIQWCSNMLKDKEAQKHLEERIQVLIDMFFKGKSDYAIEKFIKSFGEGLTYLENDMLRHRGIHPSQIEKNLVYLQSHPEETMTKMTEVKNTMMNEINRQFRHFQTFLSAF